GDMGGWPPHLPSATAQVFVGAGRVWGVDSSRLSPDMPAPCRAGAVVRRAPATTPAAGSVVRQLSNGQMTAWNEFGGGQSSQSKEWGGGHRYTARDITVRWTSAVTPTPPLSSSRVMSPDGCAAPPRSSGSCQ